MCQLVFFLQIIGFNTTMKDDHRVYLFLNSANKINFDQNQYCKQFQCCKVYENI